MTCQATGPNIAGVTSATLPSAVSAWDEPTGLRPRGTLIVLTGRGEPTTVYGRFGRRLAADAYRVRVVETRLDDLEATRREVAALIDDPDLPRPKVLVGSDAGAAYAPLLAEALEVDAVVLAGVALDSGQQTVPNWDEELEARTACPAHRGVLTDEAAFDRGRLAEPLPERLAGAQRPAAVPTLVIHGDADPVTAPASVLEAFGSAVLVAEGRHDILNDVTHRSVAATIVLFLERLRLGAELPLIVRDASAREPRHAR